MCECVCPNFTIQFSGISLEPFPVLELITLSFFMAKTYYSELVNATSGGLMGSGEVSGSTGALAN